MKPIEPDLHDQLLRRRIFGEIESCKDNPSCLRQAAKLLAESYIQSRVAAKWLGSEMGRPLLPGTLGTPPTDHNEHSTELD
jgi:hypothetical protein